MFYSLYIGLLLLFFTLPSFAQLPNDKTVLYEKTIDNFALSAVNNRSFQNGKNVFIPAPKNDIEALQNGFKLCHIDEEQQGGWEILFAKDIIIKDFNWLPYRAILYQYKKKQHLVLLQLQKDNTYYFRIFNPIFQNTTPQAQASKKLDPTYEKTIDDFAKASVNNLSFQNGLSTHIETPENDEDILYQGFRIAHTDREYNGGWTILAAKDIIIKETSWLPFRAILYTFKAKQFIVLSTKEKENQYYFRIFNAQYTED